MPMHVGPNWEIPKTECFNAWFERTDCMEVDDVKGTGEDWQPAEPSRHQFFTRLQLWY